MGANAQTSVPLFTSGEVLTAANQNISAGTGVPVFAGTSERDAAFGGSGEKVLAEGQLAYIEDTNVVQYYDGAAWETVGPSTAGGLVVVKAETAFSAVASFTADDVFSSTYTNYRIIIRYETTGGQELAMQLRAATVDTTSGYNFQRSVATATTLTAARSSSQSSAFVAQDCTTISFSTLELSGPQLAEQTFYQALNTRNSTGFTTPQVVQYFGNQSDATQFDGIKFLVSAGNTTGSYAIYGYAKTV